MGRARSTHGVMSKYKYDYTDLHQKMGWSRITRRGERSLGKSRKEQADFDVIPGGGLGAAACASRALVHILHCLDTNSAKE